MEYRVEELARASGVPVDTIRFYQGRGLLPAPERRGRVAIYREGHLARLRQVRELLEQGFRLAQIRQVLESDASSDPGPASLLKALMQEGVGDRTFTRAELAAEAGVPEALIAAAIAAGVVEPLQIDGAERFSEADLEMARMGLAVLEMGFPLNELLDLAVRHARHIGDVAESGIDLFDTHVRKAGAASSEDGEGAQAITESFQQLLPQVTRLVALHFQRTVVNRALERLRNAGEERALEKALAATGSARLEVAWRQR